ncbi:hypothetical protein E4U44_007152 [Claviceps purpurea]|nr:hypothetical protein E4U44_007152 [Claviceps purpurea]
MDIPPPAPTPPPLLRTNRMASNAERTANLLNLLKFSNAPSSSGSQQQQPPQPQPPLDRQHYPHSSRQSSYSQAHFPSPPTLLHQPAPAGADPKGLLAALMRGASHEGEESRQTSTAPHASQPTQPVEPKAFGDGPPPSNTTSFLLNLLNRPKPSQTSPAEKTEEKLAYARAYIAATRAAGAADSEPLHFSQYQQQPHQQPEAQHFPQGAESVAYANLPIHAATDHDHHYPATQIQEPPADGSALYQKVAGSLPKSSPKPLTTQPAGHRGVPAQSFQILKKDHSSPPTPHSQEQSRSAADDRSPIVSPLGQARRANPRTPSLHVHQSKRQVAKQSPPTGTDDSMTVADSSKEAVADAVHDIAEQADMDAQEALERAEHGRKHTSAVVDAAEKKISPGPERRREKAATSTVQAIEQQIIRNIRGGKRISVGSRSPEGTALKNASDSGNAIGDQTQDLADLADCWESADQEEIVVIEENEAQPVRVYNFPMKPWISISLQEELNVVRPEFRDESIMDIARLKKEFDQIDRNLYTASQTYMTYGMSRQGGLRVIRQDDGKDAKVFSDTKDRIFNVVMSVTPSEDVSVQREAIIGTGISGTVYWVQIKDGEKDHIEDTHLEQYGFALPPISSHDGDLPGGVLKTRARASTAHPEFFAVGRGKAINFVWPSYILQNKLFKVGHDRVVDTEALLKQSSLKINTGKAGKDFTFSQDDTVVVSLDKSGRVKFWDVRELTAAHQDSDPRFPLPAHSSLEINDPLLTLATTPEGEKTWPTSVFLLDKQRPYQKRGALRYMIVGMKQNHTLQLWDLALCKPVQELNLPHSKESDAVCSVMYHPESGMIVIGHPTRNSIYFAHLSAPKYNMRNVSQAEYMQRIVTQDSSILQPDSTAVISGVREYSFANRGVLRSLDILGYPAMVQDHHEPTLFELYAMHSKGVACILVKQRELGWSKDNRVLDPVDGVEEGFVAISKIKVPSQPTELSSKGGDKDLANKDGTARPAAGEATRQLTPTDTESTQRASGSASAAAAPTPTPAAAPAIAPATAPVTAPAAVPTTVAVPSNSPPVNAKSGPKEAEPSLQAAKEGPAEKPERRSRKRKGKEPESVYNTNASTSRAGAGGGAIASGSGSGSGSFGAGAQSGRAETVNKLANNGGSAVSNAVSAAALDSAMNTVQTRLTAAVSDTLKSSLKNLQGKIDEGARLRDENFNQRQVKLLDMVSEVLNENTQKVLETLIHDQFTKLVIPAIGNKATKAVSDVLQNKLQPHIASTVQKEIQSSLPRALTQSLQSADLVSTVADRVGKSINSTLQQEVATTLTQRLTPTFKNLARQSAQQAVKEVHQQYQDGLEKMQAQHAADSHKIDQLLTCVTGLTDMVSTMAASQASLQAEVLKLKQQQPAHELPGFQSLSARDDVGDGSGLGSRVYGPLTYNNGAVPVPHPQSSVASRQSSHVPSQSYYKQAQQQRYQQPQQHYQQPQPQQHQYQQYMATSPEYMRGGQPLGSSPRSSVPVTDLAVTSKISGVAGAFASQVNKMNAESEHDIQRRVQIMEQAIKEDRLQDAMIQWIQSGYAQEIFERCLSLQHPSRFEHLPPILLLVVIATIANFLRLTMYLKQEIDWVEMAVRTFADSLADLDPDQEGYRDMMGSVSHTLELLMERLRPLIAGYDTSYPVDPWLATVDKRKMEWVLQCAQSILQNLGISRP